MAGTPSTPRSPERVAELRHAIAEDEHRLQELVAEQDAVRSRLATLQAELAALEAAPSPAREAPATYAPATMTDADKVSLFRRLFRGRPDVYPARFVSQRTGKAGYAPACSNKFRPGVCELPKIKCGECSNQAFLPADDRAVIGHLRGQHVMGVYPMLDDETCWFLAVDFDKSSWIEDVRARTSPGSPPST